MCKLVAVLMSSEPSQFSRLPFCYISSFSLCNVYGYLHMLTDHICINIFLSWMMENSYSYAVKIFLHLAGGSINMNPIPPQVGQVRQKTTKWIQCLLSASALSCLLTFTTLALYDARTAQGCRLRSCPITTFRIPTPSFRYWAYDKMSVVTFCGFTWHKSFPPNCMKHSRGILKVQNSVQCANRRNVRLLLALNCQN